MLRLAYNTNGWPQHELADVAELLAELGYAGIAVTPDLHHVNPLRDGLQHARELAPRLRDLGLAVAVETGARFLLDARRKHQPTLLSEPDGARARLDLLRRCHEIAVALGAETLSFWSGAWAPPTSPEGAAVPAAPTRAQLLDRLCAGASALLDASAGSGVALCFEPEPGMLVGSLAELQEFLKQLRRDELKVMLDVGHVPVTERVTPAAALTALAPRLGGLQLDDARAGVHEHLFPGEGEIDWAALLAAARAAHFGGLSALELPRHGHDPVGTARRAMAFFRELQAER
jgi:sugar phosphate isomerase/epimerase